MSVCLKRSFCLSQMDLCLSVCLKRSCCLSQMDLDDWNSVAPSLASLRILGIKLARDYPRALLRTLFHIGPGRLPNLMTLDINARYEACILAPGQPMLQCLHTCSSICSCTASYPERQWYTTYAFSFIEDWM